MQHSIYKKKEANSSVEYPNSSLTNFFRTLQTKSILQIRQELHQMQIRSRDPNFGEILCQHLKSSFQTSPSTHLIYLLNQMIYHNSLNPAVQSYLLQFYVCIFKRAFSVKDYSTIEEMKRYRKYWVTKIDYCIYAQMKNRISYNFRFDIDILPIRAVQEVLIYYRDVLKMNQKDIEYHLPQAKQIQVFDPSDRYKVSCKTKRERSYEMNATEYRQLHFKKQKSNNWRFNILQKDSQQLSSQSTQIQSCNICHQKYCKVDITQQQWRQYATKRQTQIDQQLKYSSRLFNYRCSECDQIFLLKQSYQWHQHSKKEEPSICRYKSPEQWQIQIKQEQKDDCVLISGSESFVPNCCYYCNQSFQLQFLQFYIVRNAKRAYYRQNTVLIHPACSENLKEMENQYGEMLKQAAQEIT